MTQAQDDTFIAALKSYIASTTRPSQTRYDTFRAAAQTWLATMAPAPVPVLTPAGFTLAAGYGTDALVGHVNATNSPTSFAIVSGDPNNYFDIWPTTSNLRTSEAGPPPPAGTYTLGLTGTNAAGTGPVATFTVTAQGVVTVPPPTSPPPTGTWPEASNTGVPAGTTLANTSGRTISTAGAVVNAENISGTLTISANNVTIKNSRIRASGNWAIRVMDGVGGTIIQDCELDGLGNCGKAIRTGGAAGNGTKILRCNIHDMADGIDITGHDVLIQDSYVHNFRDPAAVPHYDGIVCDGGCNNSVVRHNFVDASAFTNEHVNSNISFNDYWAKINAPTVDNNLMKGGSGNNRILEFYGANHGSGCTNVVCTNNHIVPNGSSNILTGTGVTVTTWSGNVNDTTGATIANPY